MQPDESRFLRGSEWRQWDFHIHTPASFHWNGGKRFSQMSAMEKRASVDSMIKAINEAVPAVFVIMDYWTFEGWFALKERLGEQGAPKLLKTVFPGIELRLVAPADYRLNAHVLFSNEVTDQELMNFRGRLTVELINDRPPIS